MKKKSIVILAAVLLVSIGIRLGQLYAASQYGDVTITTSVPAAGTYRVWSRIKAPDASNNSFTLQINSGTAETVGDAAIAANTWTWVDYRNGSTSNKFNVNLAAGNVTLTLGGREPDVQVDRILLLSDSCVPTNAGDNCTVATPPGDTTPPTVSITAPSNGTTISGSSNVAASASDNTGVTNVEFYVDGSVRTSDNSSPYSYSLDTTTLSNASHSLTAKAFDAAGNNTTSSAINVTVNNAAPPPTNISVPYRTNAGGPAYTDPQGNIWAADNYGTGGEVDSQASGIDIAGTTSDTLYQSERWGQFSYKFPIANGTYRVRLHFAEIYTGCFSVGCRIFSVNAENQAKVTNLDIFQQSGQLAALVKEFDTPVTDGELTLDFILGAANSPKVSAIEVVTPTTPPSVFAPEDVNMDGIINILDFSLLSAKFGATTNLGRADINQDGKVNILDFSLLAAKFGS